MCVGVKAGTVPPTSTLPAVTNYITQTGKLLAGVDKAMAGPSVELQEGSHCEAWPRNQLKLQVLCKHTIKIL